jgi:RNA recognition motif-containing protein
LYRNADGRLKGDGRCCYIRRESVDLALQILDGYNLRNFNLKVEQAQFTLKGAYDPTKKPRKKKKQEKEKIKKMQVSSAHHEPKFFSKGGFWAILFDSFVPFYQPACEDFLLLKYFKKIQSVRF